MANIKHILAPVLFAGFTSLSMFAIDTSYYATSSRLAQGHWVKVKVNTEGVQQITYDNLRSWGFANPEQVKVYGFGSTVLADHTFSTSKPDDIQPTLSLHTDDGRLLFFGEADVRTKVSGSSYTVARNYCSTVGYYLITDAEVGGETPEAAAYSADALNTVSNHISVTLYEEEALPVGNHSCIFHSKTYKSGETISVPFTITDFDPESSYRGRVSFEIPALNTESLVTYKFNSMACSQLTMSQTKTCSISSVTDGSLLYVTGTSTAQFTPATDAETVADGEYTFSVSSTANSKVTYVALDRAVILYPRKNIKRDGSLLMHFNQVSKGANFVIEGANKNTRVWNVSNTANVFEHSGAYDADNATFTGTFDRQYISSDTDGECRLIVFNPEETQLTAEYAGEVANQDIHGTAVVPEMIIVTTNALKAQAEALADIHREHDGMDVCVFTQEQLINEFGAGNPSTMAIRRAIKMFYDRDSQKLKNLLLYGKSIYDNRQIAASQPYETLLCFEVEPVSGVKDLATAASYSNISFGSDDYYGLLEDTDTPSNFLTTKTTVDIAVGRIPAPSEEYASAVNAKIADYLKNPLPAEVMRRAILVSDNGDDNKHLNQSVGMYDLLSANRPDMTAVQAHCLLYEHLEKDAPLIRAVTEKCFNEGVGLYCYNGHGNPVWWGDEYYWSMNCVDAIEYKYLPLIMMATCSPQTYDRTEASIGEMLLQKNGGGAIAAIGPNRTVYLDGNKYMCEALIDTYTNASGEVSIGEIYRLTHNKTINSYDLVLRFRINTMCYSLLGDPAVKLRFPEKTAEVTAINGVDAAETAAISPRTTVNVKANITDGEGNIDKSFNGTATVTFYESPHDVSTFVLISKDLDATVSVDEQALATKTVRVENGVIDADIYVPENTYASSADNLFKIAISATNSDGSFAAGALRNRYYGDADNSNTAFTGKLPEITELYLTTANSDNATATGKKATLNASLTVGDAGLSVTNALKSSSQLLLDGNRVVANPLPLVLDGDGNATLQYSFDNLIKGEHTLTLIIVDNAGNRVERSLDFTVGISAALAADKYNVHDDITFTLEHTYSLEPKCRFIVEDGGHNTVLAVDNATFPYTLSATDVLTDGFYSAYVLTDGTLDKLSTNRVSFVVTR